jgi:hypothetical protein
MKKITEYQQLKALLKDAAAFAKKHFVSDKPAQRQYINDCLDIICKDYKVSEYKRNLLSNFACNLHPKN